ncbi:MAG: hypothetical protein PHQ20_04815, partial [Candidatus Moranbacteria bacterium]|nr:hypothetical protein [Candidatus Moranbacteria bacterium]
IPKIINNQVESIPQNKKNATFTKIVRKEDGKIDWQNMTPEQIERMSRAYKPWPGVYSFWNNKKVDFSDIEIIDINKNSNLFDKKIIKEIKPGFIKVINNKVLIGTKNGIVAPNKIKIEGKKALPTKDFICGYQDFKDTMLN